MANYSQNLLAGSCGNVPEEPYPGDGCPYVYHEGHGHHGGGHSWHGGGHYKFRF